jgi:hypothetical protein
VAGSAQDLGLALIVDLIVALVRPEVFCAVGEPAVNVTGSTSPCGLVEGGTACAAIGHKVTTRREQSRWRHGYARRAEDLPRGCPWAGETYAMLGEAHRRAGRGADVVVGLVEPHGRSKTAALIEGLEVLPRRRLTHRGVVLTELDVDAVLARAPQVVLVDELARRTHRVAGSPL